MKFVCILICVHSTAISFGQTTEKELTAASTPGVYQFVEKMPKPPYDMGAYLSNNLHYPERARRKNTQGRVIVGFVVNEDGSIYDAKVVRGIGMGCDEEALRVIKTMPAWRPGTQNGKLVKVRYTQPITFKLQ